MPSRRASGRSPRRACALPAGERCERPSSASVKALQRPARPLGAGAGGEAAVGWPGLWSCRSSSPHRWRSLEARDKRSNVTAYVRKNHKSMARRRLPPLKALPAFEEAARHLELQRRRARAQSHAWRHQPADEVARDASRRATVPSSQSPPRADRGGGGLPAGGTHRARRRRSECGAAVDGDATGAAGRLLPADLHDALADPAAVRLQRPASRDRRAPVGVVGAGRLRARRRRCGDPHRRRRPGPRASRRMPS